MASNQKLEDNRHLLIFNFEPFNDSKLAVNLNPTFFWDTVYK